MNYNPLDLLKDMLQSNITPDDQLYELLCHIEPARLAALTSRLKSIRSADADAIAKRRRDDNKKPTPRQHKIFTKKSVTSKLSQLTGKLLERVIAEILTNCTLIQTYNNIRSTTAEIDFMVQLGIMANLIPIFRDAGTHFLGEAKCYSSGFKQEWVNELAGLMDQHQCTLSIIFVASPSKVMTAPHRTGIYIHSIKGKHIIPFGLKQIEEIISGKNFLSILLSQCVKVKSGAADLAI